MYIIKKKLACGLVDPSDGLHDPSLERTNWNTDRLTAKGLKPLPGLGERTKCALSFLRSFIAVIAAAIASEYFRYKQTNFIKNANEIIHACHTLLLGQTDVKYYYLPSD